MVQILFWKDIINSIYAIFISLLRLPVFLYTILAHCFLNQTSHFIKTVIFWNTVCSTWYFSNFLSNVLSICSNTSSFICEDINLCFLTLSLPPLSALAGVLVSFISAWYNLEISKKRKPQLRNCLYKNQL